MEIVMGTFAEKVPDSEKMSNTTMFIYPKEKQEPVVYRKLHLFDVTLPSGDVLNESSFTVAGNAVVSAHSRAGNMGMAICYDLRFAELFLELRRRECNLFVLPSAFTYETGQDHWEVLIKARAIENQAYVVAAAQVGEHYRGRHSYGHSIIVGPWGHRLAEFDDSDEGVIYADFNIDYVRHIRRHFPIHSHRKVFTDRG